MLLYENHQSKWFEVLNLFLYFVFRADTAYSFLELYFPKSWHKWLCPLCFMASLDFLMSLFDDFINTEQKDKPLITMATIIFINPHGHHRENCFQMHYVFSFLFSFFSPCKLYFWPHCYNTPILSHYCCPLRCVWEHVVCSWPLICSKLSSGLHGAVGLYSE